MSQCKSIPGLKVEKKEDIQITMSQPAMNERILQELFLDGNKIKLYNIIRKYLYETMKKRDAEATGIAGASLV